MKAATILSMDAITHADPNVNKSQPILPPSRISATLSVSRAALISQRKPIKRNTMMEKASSSFRRLLNSAQNNLLRIPITSTSQLSMMGTIPVKLLMTICPT
jgi:hypothetical protein